MELGKFIIKVTLAALTLWVCLLIIYAAMLFTVISETLGAVIFGVAIFLFVIFIGCIIAA